MHLAPVRTGRRWCGPGDRRPRELYDEREVRRIAEALAKQGGENPYRPNMRLHNTPRADHPRSTVSSEVPEGWVTTAEIRDAFISKGIDVTARTVRRLLEQNCVGAPRPDEVDMLINEAFGLLLDEARQPRPPLRVPSEVRLVGQRLQRVYPHDEALDWLQANHLDLGFEGRIDAYVDFRGEVGLHGVKWRREFGRRNPWMAFVEALVSGGHQRVVGAAHRIAAFILDRKKQWLSEQATAAAITAELRGALAKSVR